MARYEVTWDYEGSHAPITNYTSNREEALTRFANLIQKATGASPIATDLPTPIQPQRITLRKIGPDENTVSIIAAYDVRGLTPEGIKTD